jgi:hypothetical protein
VIRRWLIDAADRLEAAAELARELRAAHGSAGVVLEGIRLRNDFLADRLWDTAQRLGILQSLGSDARAQVALRLCDLYRVARRAHALAQAEGRGALADGFDVIGSDLRALLGELEAAGWVCDPPAIPPAGARRVLLLPAAPAEDARSRAPTEGVLRRSRPASANEAPSARERERASEVANQETVASPATGGCR